MCRARTVLGVRDIMGNEIDILSEHRGLQRRAMRRNTKITFLRGRALVKMRWRKSLTLDFHFKNVSASQLKEIFFL